MSAVSANAVELLRSACERERLALSDLGAAFEVAATRRAPLAWSAFLDALARYRARIMQESGRESPLPMLGEAMLDAEVGARLRAIVGAFTAPKLMYRALAGWAIPTELGAVLGHYEELDERRVKLVFEIEPGAAGSPLPFELCVGLCRALPRLFDLADATIEAQLGQRRAELLVTMPPSGSTLARLRRAAHALSGPQGLLAALEAQVAESSARARAAEAARDALFRALERFSEGAIVLRGGLVVFANASFAKLAGQAGNGAHTAAAFVGRELLDLVVPREQTLAEAILAGDPGVGRALHFSRAGGGEWLGEVGPAEPIGDAADEMTLVVVKRPAAEARAAALRSTAERELLASLVEHGNDFIAATDLEGRLSFLNQAGAALLGFASPADAIGRTLFELAGDTARPIVVGEELPAVRRSGAWMGASELRSAIDGSSIAVEVSSFLLTLPGESAPRWIGTIRRDVRATRALEEELSRARRLDALGRLAGGIAHDFNNVLTAISMHVEVLLEVTPDTSPNRADLEQIRSAAERAGTMTRSLLAFGRKQPSAARAIPLDEVVLGVEPLVRRLIGAQIMLDVRTSRGVIVRVDAAQVERVLTNLAINARDAMPHGGRLAIDASSVELGDADARGLGLAPGPYARLRVRDTGHGMDAETRARIFDPFFTTKRVVDGSGLGLAIVDGFVRQAGGAVRVESAVGRGSTFDVFLPRDASDAGAASGASDLSSRGSETVLVVDDEAPIRAAVRRALQRSGYTVVEAADGGEALEVVLAASAAPDLVLTDVRMPRLGGIALAEQLRELRPDLPVLFMSGYADDLFESGEIPPGRLLPKPFAPSTLTAIIRDILDGTRRQRRTGSAGPPST
jgi:PAS domain S-box-containing protein